MRHRAVPVAHVDHRSGGELTGFPFPVGEARIYRIEPGFAPTIFATGFTMISDLAFGADGSLYALEYDRGRSRRTRLPELSFQGLSPKD